MIPDFKDITRILVVGNSRHHSSNLILLSEKLQENYGNIVVVVVSDPGDIDFYNSKVRLPTTKVLSFGRFTFFDAGTKEETNRNAFVKVSITYRIYELCKLYYNKSKSARYILNFAKNSSIGCLLLQKKNIIYYKIYIMSKVTPIYLYKKCFI